MHRRSFLASVAAGVGSSTLNAEQEPQAPQTARLADIRKPLAITMWDFSWLERRWPGAGYEDWDLVLNQLVERGYNAVRIDAYPHLVAAAPEKMWELLPCWNTQDWGSPAKNRVQVQPALNQFIRKCADRGLRVALSTWFRQDTANTRMQIKSPRDHGRIWSDTLASIEADGLLPHLLYVDLCNEFPLDVWAPFVPKGMLRATPQGTNWMRQTVEAVRQRYPKLDYTFSMTSEWDTWRQQDVSMLDFLELHIWMAQSSDYYKEVGYNYEKFSPEGYEHLVDRAKPVYDSRPAYWQQKLKDRIALAAEWSRFSKHPLITTECWSLVDYKDWPLLEWGWLKELCEIGVRSAAATGRWVAIATSNFCGPQFAGMWRDVDWHKRMTDVIHNAEVHLE
ncbi:MAG TPA: cellulase-like family protein [Bryobacteraceae bacterium]|nr:cellulase-like family protein [Bryobacteraceae bacterium]